MFKKVYAEASSRLIKSPMEYIHVKIIRCILTIIGFWPFKECEQTARRWAWLLTVNNVIWTSLIASGTTGYLIIHYAEHTFMELIQIILTIIMSYMSSLRVLTLPFSAKYRKTVGAFFTKIHLIHHKDRSDYGMEIHTRVHMYCNICVVSISAVVLVGPLLNNMSFIYANIAQGKLDQPYLNNSKYEYLAYYMFPSDATTSRTSYFYVSVFNFFVSFLWCFNVFIVDLYVVLMVFHVWGHFKILRNNLCSIQRPARKPIGVLDNGIFTDDELKGISSSLKQCINYHRFIISYINEMSNAFGLMLLSYYVFQQMCCCLFLLISSEMTLAAFCRFGLLTIVIFCELVLMYSIFEMIGTASEEIIDAVYGVPWDCMDVPNRKTVLIFMMITQKPVHVKAMGIVDIGVNSMTSVLKTSFSYYTFLRTIPESK